MGFDLKGKDLGKGLSQRKRDGKYRGRYKLQSGQVIERSFDTERQARIWLDNIVYEDANFIPIVSHNVSVNEAYKVWIEHKEATTRPNTVRNCRNRYDINIKKHLGRMKVVDVKPLHIQKVLDTMKEEGYRRSTIKQCFLVLQNFFYFLYENDYIRKTAVISSVVISAGEQKKEIDFFTLEEQKRFLQVAKDYAYYEQLSFLLFTGLRVSEMIGLEWKCVDLENRTLTVEKVLEYRYERKAEVEREMKKTGQTVYRKSGVADDSKLVVADGWYRGQTKTKNSARTIKLSSQAVEILERLKTDLILMIVHQRNSEIWYF